jgi:long-subunit fatty acid transport protein
VALSLNGYVGELAIAPLPNGVYDTVGDDSTRYYPHGDGLSNSYAVSVQPGFLYRVNDMIAIGGSLTTAQNFDPFEWNSTFAHPDDPNFGKHRLLEYDLDGPLNVTLGTGIKLSPKTKIAADVTWFRYDGVSGFGSPGGIVDRVIQPFGWKNVWAYKLGGEHKFNEKQTLRLGYNYGSTPLPKKNTLTATGAPAFFKHHFSLGLSYRVTDHVRADLGAYHVPRGGNVGPLLDLDNNEIGTVDESNTLTSVQLGFSWAFGGSHTAGSHAAGNSAARN